MDINQRNHPLPAAVAFLDVNNTCGRSICCCSFCVAAKTLHLMNLFSGSLWEICRFLPKELSWPRAGFIWYEIYFTSQSMWYNPSGKLRLLSACLLLLPPPFSCTFQGNSHDENTERGDLSMYQICWEASESEVQLHRQIEGETWLKSCSGRELFLFHAQLFIPCDRVEKVQCHYFLAHKYLMQFHPSCICCVCFVHAICKPAGYL